MNATTRVDPRYNVINSVQSPGESTYQNMTLQLTRRQYKGIGFDFAYTLGKSEDNAPITGTLSVQGDAGRVDMTSLDRDLGPNILDQRHTFVGSIVATPQFERGGTSGAILNNNVFGVAMQFASGIPVNLRSNLELNNDGTASDRPLNVPRNSLTLPSRKNVDFRYSRKFRIQGSMAAEVIAELKNVFNTEQVSSVNATVVTNAQGVPTAPLPTSGSQLTPTGGYEQRQFQLGFKFMFLAEDSHGVSRRTQARGILALASCPRSIVSRESQSMRRAFLRSSPSSSPLLSAHSTAQHQLVPVAAAEGRNRRSRLQLRKLDTVGNFMMTTAHPDDENNAMLAYFSHGKGYRTSLVTATHGEGGQNEIGPELFVPLAVLRTEELLAAHRFDGAEQFFTRAIDFGFSFSVEETLEKWGHDEILGDYVRMIRTIRPDVIVGFVFDGDGGGQHHQTSSRLTLEAFRAAADPAKFPEQIKEGLRPWQAKKFYYTAGFGGPGGRPPSQPAAASAGTGSGGSNEPEFHGRSAVRSGARPHLRRNWR